MILNLSPDDFMEAVTIAYGRNKMKQDAGVSDVAMRTRPGENDEEKHFVSNLIGAMGELATARVLCAPMNTEISLHGDDGVDLISEGVTVQVKSSDYSGPTPYLYFKSPDDFVADLYVYCRIMWPNTVAVISCCSVAEYWSKAKYVDRFNAWVALTSDLTTMETYLRYRSI